MLILPPAKFRRQRGRVEYRNAETPTPPAPLVLLSATYDESGPTLTLAFDRAVKIDAFDGSQIGVQDQPNAWQLVGTWAELLDALTVQVALLQVDTASGYEVLLDASAASGIVAVEDGGTWAGVNALQLPYP